MEVLGTSGGTLDITLSQTNKKSFEIIFFSTSSD